MGISQGSPEKQKNRIYIERISDRRRNLLGRIFSGHDEGWEVPMMAMCKLESLGYWYSAEIHIQKSRTLGCQQCNSHSVVEVQEAWILECKGQTASSSDAQGKNGSEWGETKETLSFAFPFCSPCPQLVRQYLLTLQVDTSSLRLT